MESAAQSVGDAAAEALKPHAPGEPAAPQAPPAEPEAVTPECPVTPDLLRRIHARISVVLRLDELEKLRQAIQARPDLPPEVTDEFARQRREVQRFPSTESAQKAIAQLQKRQRLLDKPATPPEASDQAEPPAEGRQVHPALLEALQIGLEQASLLLQRDELTGPLLSAAASAMSDEPLRALLSAAPEAAERLFGWTVYASALQGIRRRLARQAGSAAPEAAGQIQSVIRAATRELGAIEPAAAQAFWCAYDDAAALLGSGIVPPEAQAPLRAFLRHGMVSAAPWLLPPARARAILRECAEPVRDLDLRTAATHVLYADEYIDLVARGQITPSIDEDLELNHPGSSDWKRDRAWRRIVATRVRRAGFEETLASLAAQAGALQQDVQQAEQELSQVKRDQHDYKKRRHVLKERAQAGKVMTARLTIAAEHIRTKVLPVELEKADEAQKRLAALGGPPAPEDLARREAALVRKVTRLLNKLKEPLLPLCLRDEYRPEAGVVNDRATVLAELLAVERADTTAFKEVAVNAKLASRRTYVRFSPCVLLAPGPGVMGFALNPRSGTEVGRLVLPTYCRRAGTLKPMLASLLADFTWDTSRESAGIDLLTSDTLVAAYASVRWEYRKRSKEVREKAGIYTDENDRSNWRRHYALFLASAHEGGKKLFFRCPEVYEAAVKYLGLPEGAQKLSK